MVVAIRTGCFSWILLATTAVAGILFVWHLAMIFSFILDSFQTSYGAFIFFTFAEILGLIIPLALGIVSTFFKILSPCVDPIFLTRFLRPFGLHSFKLVVCALQ